MIPAMGNTRRVASCAVESARALHKDNIVSFGVSSSPWTAIRRILVVMVRCVFHEVRLPSNLHRRVFAVVDGTESCMDYARVCTTQACVQRCAGRLGKERTHHSCTIQMAKRLRKKSDRAKVTTEEQAIKSSHAESSFAVHSLETTSLSMFCLLVCLQLPSESTSKLSFVSNTSPVIVSSCSFHMVSW